jgi:hypothetical protein
MEIILGKSYYHRPQGVGPVFKPQRLVGYFSDLTARVNFVGEVDQDGIPLNVLLDGRRVYFATTIILKALAHHDKWLIEKRNEDLDEFVKLSRWLLIAQDKQGGWNVRLFLGPGAVSNYSALVQGEAVSLLVRAWKVTREIKFKESASKAIGLLLKPVEEGGVAFYEDNDIFLEEIPSYPRSTILNGWIFALMGLYDYWLAYQDKEVWVFFVRTLKTLEKHLKNYDCGYWSHYDVRGNIASPFYHKMHIALLEALYMVSSSPVFLYYAKKWKMYQSKFTNRLRAFIVKAYQKLKKPTPVVVVK